MKGGLLNRVAESDEKSVLEAIYMFARSLQKLVYYWTTRGLSDFHMPREKCTKRATWTTKLEDDAATSQSYILLSSPYCHRADLREHCHAAFLVIRNLHSSVSTKLQNHPGEE